MNNRFIFSKGGVVEDISTSLSYYYNECKQLNIEVGDFLYISSRLPFNNIFFNLFSVSTASATIILEYYTGNSWVPVVDSMDETLGFTQSGVIQFTPDRQQQWQKRSTNESGESVEGLESIRIYDQYWLRISFSENIGDVELKWAGNLFSNDNDLAIEYPVLVRSNTITSFKTGKTNWEEQHIKASELLINDLINRGIINGAGQILDWREFTSASVSKTAEVIFNSFGDDYIDNTVSSKKEYNERLSKRILRVDTNNDAIESSYEGTTASSGYFTR